MITGLTIVNPGSVGWQAEETAAPMSRTRSGPEERSVRAKRSATSGMMEGAAGLR
jgi:hypothetical protein